MLHDPKWVAAEEIRQGMLVRIPAPAATSVPVPIGIRTDLDFWWIVGFWLAEGWRSFRQRPGRPEGQIDRRVLFAVNDKELRSVEDKLEKIFHVVKTRERTAWRLTVVNESFCGFLGDFGKGAEGKTVPAWVFGLPHQTLRSLLDGYLDGDGWRKKDGSWRTTTVSYSLARAIQHLGVLVEGRMPNVSVLYRQRTSVIEGRTVSCRQAYCVEQETRHRSTVVDEMGAWAVVRKVDRQPYVGPVCNMEVEEDNTYVAHGIAVHNCQGLSVAGLRKGLSDDRSGLFWELVRILEQKRPRWILLENVPGLLTTCSCPRCGKQCKICRSPAGDEDESCQVCGSENLGGRVLPEHRGTDFFVVLTALQKVGYGVQTRILDSQYLGVPQRRRRLFIVGHLGAPCPPEILFESQGGGGDPSEGGQEGPLDTREVARSVGGVGGGQDYGAGKGTLASQEAETASAVTASAGHHRHSSPRGDGTDNLVTGTIQSCSDGQGRKTPEPDQIVAPTSEKAHAVSKGTGGGLGGRDGQDDYVIQPADATAFHRNANCSVTDQSVTDQRGVAAALKGEGEHSYQFIAQPVKAATVTPGTGGTEKGWAPMNEADNLVVAPQIASPLTAGSHPNSNAPSRRREDDENLVVAPPEPLAIDRFNQRVGSKAPTLQSAGGGNSTFPAVAFDAHNSPKEKSGTLCGGEKGGGKNEINLPLVAQGVGPGETPRKARPEDDRQLRLFGDEFAAGAAGADGAGPEPDVIRMGFTGSDPHVKKPGVTDALDSGTGHGGCANQAVAVPEPMTVCKGSDPITTEGIAQPVTGRKGDPGTVAFEPRHFTRPGKAGGRPAGTAGITNVHKAGDSAPHVMSISDGPTPKVGEDVAPSLVSKGTRNTGGGGKGFAKHAVAVDGEPDIIEGDSAASTPALPRLRAGCGRAGETAVAIQEDGQNGVAEYPTAGSVRADAPGHQPGGSLVGFQESQSGVRESDVNGTLDSNFGSRRHEGVAHAMTVRRLTPTECERLQGFPDGHTCLCSVGADCPDRRIPPWVDPGKIRLDGCGHSACGCKCPDSARYRSLGNSVAVPCIRWIARRLRRAMEAATTKEGL